MHPISAETVAEPPFSATLTSSVKARSSTTCIGAVESVDWTSCSAFLCSAGTIANIVYSISESLVVHHKRQVHVKNVVCHGLRSDLCTSCSYVGNVSICRSRNKIISSTNTCRKSSIGVAEDIVNSYYESSEESIVKKLIIAKRKRRKTSEYQSAVHYSHQDLGHPKGRESEVGQVFPHL